MKRRYIIAALITSLTLFFAMIMITNPANLSSIALIFPFFLSFAALWCGAFLLLRSTHVGRLRATRLSAVIAGLPIGLMLLQSIGQLSFRDAMIILTFFAVAYFYIDRITTPKQNDI